MFQFIKPSSIWVITAWSCIVTAGVAQDAPQRLLPPPVDMGALEALDDGKLQQLRSGDPFLTTAYAQFFVINFDGPSPPWQRAVRRDIARRGNEATRMLVDMFHATPQAPALDFRADLMFKIQTLEGMPLNEYVAAARRLFATEGLSLPPRTIYAMASLFEHHGSVEELAILREMQAHPSGEVALVIKPAITRMENRLGATRNSSRAKSGQGHGEPDSASVLHPAPRSIQPESDERQPRSFAKWWTWPILLLTAAVLVLLWRKVVS